MVNNHGKIKPYIKRLIKIIDNKSNMKRDFKDPVSIR